MNSIADKARMINFLNKCKDAEWRVLIRRDLVTPPEDLSDSVWKISKATSSTDMEIVINYSVLARLVDGEWKVIALEDILAIGVDEYIDMDNFESSNMVYDYFDEMGCFSIELNGPEGVEVEAI